MKESNVHIVIESDSRGWRDITSLEYLQRRNSKRVYKSLMLEHIDSGDLDQLPNGGL